ncbi:hypothetical protein V2J09_017012 [Rumex salicifolius]
MYTSSNPSAAEQDNRRLLERSYSKEEVMTALKQMHPLKAPGLDDRVIKLVLKPLNTRKMSVNVNKTFITLIPKKNQPIEMKDFRPISMCNVIYKLISKTIANRLKGDQVIASNQSTFILERLISDNYLIAFEMFHRMSTGEGRHKHFALKLDMSKAYDRISHLLYTDDCIIFNRSDKAQAETIKNILATFEMASWQRVNMEKTKITFCKVTKDNVKAEIAQILGISQREGCQEYMGLPTRVGRSKKVIFEVVKGKLEKKLKGWGYMHLSKARRAVLIKVVAQSIPTYAIGQKETPCSKDPKTPLHVETTDIGYVKPNVDVAVWEEKDNRMGMESNAISPLLAETRTMFEGLQLALLHSLGRIQAKSDNEVLINVLMLRGKCPVEIMPIINDIRSISRRFANVVWSHTKREGNCKAQELARLQPWVEGSRSWDFDLSDHIWNVANLDLSKSNY